MLQGSLSEMPLLSLLQTLLTSSRSGAIRIRTAEVTGVLFLERGLVVHAQASDLNGEAALEFLSGLRKAKFKFEADVPSPSPTLPGGLETYQRLADMIEHWKELKHLPEDWGELLQVAPNAQNMGMETNDLKVMSALQDKTIAGGLISSGAPLNAARSLDRLIEHKVVFSKPQLNVNPIWLTALNLYGPNQGVAYVEEKLFAQWRRTARNPIGLKLRHKGQEYSLALEPRPNIAGRIALFERDLKRLKLSRGVAVEAWPYIP